MSNPTSDRIVLKISDVIKALKPNERLDIRYDEAYGSAVAMTVKELGLPTQCSQVIAWRISGDHKHMIFEFHPGTASARSNAMFREWALSHGLVHGTEKEAKVFLSDGPDNSVSISSYPFESDEYDSYHIDVLDNFNHKKMTQGALRATLGNVLRKANVNVIEE